MIETLTGVWINGIFLLCLSLLIAGSGIAQNDFFMKHIHANKKRFVLLYLIILSVLSLLGTVSFGLMEYFEQHFQSGKTPSEASIFAWTLGAILTGTVLWALFESCRYTVVELTTRAGYYRE